MNGNGRLCALFSTSACCVLLACGVVFLAAGCGKEDSADSADAVPTGPGKEVTFSEDLQIKGMPRSVISYGGGTSITLSKLTRKSVQVTRRSDEEFLLIVCCKTKKRLLVVHFDKERRLIITEPKGRHGNAGFTVEGYKLKGDRRGGIIEFSFPSSMFGLYDMGGDKGKMYAFCLKGTLSTHRASSGKEPFQAISNVLEIDMDF